MTDPANYRRNELACPHCWANLQGEPIPEKSQHLFGATHFGRKIGCYDIEEDRTIHYECPDCGGKIGRDEAL